MAKKSILIKLLTENDTMNKNNSFPWSPFAIGAFILSAITGLLIYIIIVAGFSQSTLVWLSGILALVAELGLGVPGNRAIENKSIETGQDHWPSGT